MTDTRKIRWGMLGTKEGLSGEIVKAFQASETSILHAIGSRDLNRAMEFAKKYDVPNFYGRYADLLSDNNIDAVYICLPNHLHEEWSIRSLEAGKHVLCEKPSVLTVQGAQRVFDSATKHKKVFAEGLMNLYHPFTVDLQKILDSKNLGTIKHITATYNCNIAKVANTTAGGAILSLGCYPLSLVRLLASLFTHTNLKMLMNVLKSNVPRLRLHGNIVWVMLLYWRHG